MSRFDEDETSLNTEGLVLAQVGTANPTALRIASLFVRKYAFNHKNFLSAVMPVGIEIRMWRPSHQGCVACVVFGQWHHHEPVDHARGPRRPASVNHNPLVVVRR